MKEIDKSKQSKENQEIDKSKVNNEMIIELLKNLTVVYNTTIQGKLLDANDIQKINNVFLSLLIFNERNYFENAIKSKDLEKDKFNAYLKMRYKFVKKQLEVMLNDLETKLMESRDKKEQKPK